MKPQLMQVLFIVLPLATGLGITQGAAAHENDWWQNRVEQRRPTAEVSERDLRRFDAFLDSHWETANLLYQDPDLINSRHFLRDHPDLRDWLDEHSEMAEALHGNPHKYLWRERAYQAREERRSPARMSERDLSSFEDYLDAHWETANLLYRDPDLIKDRRFVRDHAALRNWLEDHPDAAEAIQANPHKYLWRERTVGSADFLHQLLK